LRMRAGIYTALANACVFPRMLLFARRNIQQQGGTWAAQET